MVKTLLVIECQGNLNWYSIFEGAMLGEEKIVVEQCEWPDCSLVSYSKDGVIVSIKKADKPHPGTSQMNDRTVKIDFLLLRSVTWSIHGQNSKNLLYALMHSNIPGVNSTLSAYMCLERPLVYGALASIQKRLGKDKFPLIEQNYYSSFRDLLFTPDFPVVVKVGHCHAGYGKMKVNNQNELMDVRSIIALHGDYSTAEPFIDWDWDGRVQKIGSHYRVFKRMSANWKGNVGNQSIIEDHELTDEFKMWADECSKLFGGLDIIGLDFVHDRATGKYIILELNDTAIGLVHKYAEEDMKFMRDVVIMRMEQHFFKKNDADNSAETKSPEVTALEEKVRQLELELQRANDRMKTIIKTYEDERTTNEENKKEKKSFFSKIFGGKNNNKDDSSDDDE